MKVLVADKFEQSGLDGLDHLGAEVVYEPTAKGEALAELLKSSQAAVLVVRSTKVTKEIIAAANLSVIIRAGAGVNTIDIDAASQMGVRVTNCPGKNSHAVAELAFGLIIACDRHIPENVVSLRAGKWEKGRFSEGRGLYGRTLGLMGLGRVSQEMIPIARAFGMNVVAHSRWMTPDIAAALGIGRASNVMELAAMSDVVSVHVALTPETERVMNGRFFEAMKPNAIFVNTSRAEVVDQDALVHAVKTRGIIAGLDVFESEPSGATGTYNGQLKDLPNIYCTHHIGASTGQAQDAIAAEVVRIIREFKTHGTVPNVVNVRAADAATHLVVVRHLDRVGVLAHVLGVLKDEGVNVQEMENIVLGGAKAAIAQISVSKEPTAQAVLAIKLNENIFDCSVIPMSR